MTVRGLLWPRVPPGDAPMKRYLTIANLILVAALAYFGVHAVYRLADLPLEADVRPSERPVVVAGQSGEAALQPAGHYRVIADRNLFNTTGPAAAQANAVDLESLDRTGLKLKLWGTVAGGKENAYAVIEDEREKRQRLYHPGDQVQGAEVRMILREKVVLRVNGRDEILSIQKPHGGIAAVPRVREGSDSPQNSRVTLQSSQVSAALGDLYTLAQQATIRPHFTQGRRDGFLLAKVQPRSVFSQMGLRTGDIIKSINGQAITSVGQALNLYKNLIPGSEVEVRIAREGSDQTLQYAIE